MCLLSRFLTFVILTEKSLEICFFGIFPNSGFILEIRVFFCSLLKLGQVAQIENQISKSGE